MLLKLPVSWPAEPHLDPELMAVLLVVRRRLIEEHGATTAAELMLVDGAVLSYYHTLRINGWIGNFPSGSRASSFQRAASPWRRRTPPVDTRIGRTACPPFWAEHIVDRIREQLLPLFDRSNRVMIRNLKALQARQDGSAPSVSIGSAGQVNVAQAQVNANTGTQADEAADDKMG